MKLSSNWYLIFTSKNCMVAFLALISPTWREFHGGVGPQYLDRIQLYTPDSVGLHCVSDQAYTETST
jgi:hypothetical protein